MPEITLKLNNFHAGQQKVYDESTRFNVLECGRRFGKTTMGVRIAIEAALKGQRVGWFAPTYKTLMEQYKEIRELLKPITKTSSRTDQIIHLINGGIIDFWSLDNPDSGRGRKYHEVILDEASIVRHLQDAWEGAIRPTLTDFKGRAWFLFTPKGRNYAHQLFQRGQDGRKGWKSWRLCSVDNPLIDKEEIEEARRDLPRHVFEQEYLGIPAEDGGCPFDIKAIDECAQEKLSEEKAVVYGIDLAKSYDWTVVTGLDAKGNACFLERWQSPWTTTIEKIAEIVGDTPALVDSTGVGDPIVEQLQARISNVEGFKFSATSKQQLMEGLAVAIQTQAVQFPTGWLVDELKCFEYEYTKTGVRYNAPQGLHDDGVCSLALAVKMYYDRPQPFMIHVVDERSDWQVTIDDAFDDWDD